MRFYQHEWDDLPKKMPLDAFFNTVSVLIHLILPIQIYIYRKREQKRDIEQQHQVGPNQGSNSNHFSHKYFIDLVFNYFIILLMFSGYHFVRFLNR